MQQEREKMTLLAQALPKKSHADFFSSPTPTLASLRMTNDTAEAGSENFFFVSHKEETPIKRKKEVLCFVIWFLSRFFHS